MGYQETELKRLGASGDDTLWQITSDPGKPESETHCLAVRSGRIVAVDNWLFNEHAPTFAVGQFADGVRQYCSMRGWSINIWGRVVRGGTHTPPPLPNKEEGIQFHRQGALIGVAPTGAPPTRKRQFQIGDLVTYVPENVHTHVTGYVWSTAIGVPSRIVAYKLDCGINAAWDQIRLRSTTTTYTEIGTIPADSFRFAK